MKHVFFFTTILFLSSLNGQTSISGRVRSLQAPHDGTFRIVFIQDMKRIDSTESAAGGFFYKNIPQGLYHVQLFKKGFNPVTVKDVLLSEGNNLINMSVAMKPLESASISRFPRPFNYKYKREEYDDETTRFYIHRRCAEPTIIVCPLFMHREGTDDIARTRFEPAYTSPAGSEPGTRTIKAGRLTSGHWRDLDHWDEWTQALKKDSVSKYQQEWGFFPGEMIKISFETSEHSPLAFTQVALLDHSGRLAWQTFTDQDGNAWFWPDLYEKNKDDTYSVKVIQAGREQSFSELAPYLNTGKKLTVPSSSPAKSLLELAFLVDATGSMGDEIHFLQAELQDVITRVQVENPCLQIRTGSVFYRDQKDEYLTKVLPLNDNPFNTISFIQDQQAEGGGDFPEAPDKALEDALEQLGWTSGQHPRLMFLLLDAPPHQDADSKERMRLYVKKAAEMGIRIIPIAASGINESTEFLMKNIAIATNGEYMYLTDDSRTGEPHLRPGNGIKDVAFFNRLMTDVINSYSRGDWCKDTVIEQAFIDTAAADSVILASEDKDETISLPIELIAAEGWYMTFNPNPADHTLQVHFSEEAEAIRVCDLNGKTLYEFKNNGLSVINLDISDWSSGIYMVHATRKHETISGKLLVMH